MTGQYRDSRAKPTPELERLAREGRAARSQALDSAANEAQVAGDRHLREALAAVHGSPTGGALKAVAAGCMMAAVAMMLLNRSIPPAVGIVTLVAGIILGLLGSAMAPRANDAALELERGWCRSLPFTLEGYFEVLSTAPRDVGGVRAHVTWADGVTVDETLLADAFAAVDPGASLDHSEGSDIVFVSGCITGRTGGSINRVPVLRNHRYPAYIRALVEKVLVPLAQSHPIEKVRLEAV